MGTARHPLVTAGAAASIFTIGGVLAATSLLLSLKSGPDYKLSALAGAAVGASGAALWAYAFVKSFDVTLTVGRTVFALTLIAAVATVGAVLLRPPAQVFCAAVVAARLLPQAVFAIAQGILDVRDPQGRRARLDRAMTMAVRK